MEDLYAFLPLLGIAVLFWLLVVRPASRRQKAVLRMQAELEVGQRVMLASGIFGTIRALDGDEARLEIAPGVEVDVVRAAITTGPDPESPSEAASPSENGTSPETDT